MQQRQWLVKHPSSECRYTLVTFPLIPIQIASLATKLGLPTASPWRHRQLPPDQEFSASRFQLLHSRTETHTFPCSALIAPIILLLSFRPTAATEARITSGIDSDCPLDSLRSNNAGMFPAQCPPKCECAWVLTLRRRGGISSRSFGQSMRMVQAPDEFLEH